LLEIDIVLQILLDVRGAREERPLFGSGIPMALALYHNSCSTTGIASR
jgi:hypothetical protein